MKKFYLTAVLAFLITSLFAAPKITSKTAYGSWSRNSTWDLNRLPKNNDTVIIPAGFMIVVDENVSINKLYLKVEGTLMLLGGSLDLGNTSDIFITSTGIVTGFFGLNASDVIKIGGVQKFAGNQSPVRGAVYANSTTGSGFSSFAVLPVKFTAFSVQRKNNDVIILQWSAAEELNAARYEVERSEDGISWNTVATVAVSIGHTYSYTDKAITTKVAYYRIKEVDVDGNFMYSIVKSVGEVNSGANQIKIAAVYSNVLVKLPAEWKGKLVLRIVSLSGQVIAKQVYHNPINKIVFSKGSLKGNYIISVSNDSEINVAAQVIL